LHISIGRWTPSSARVEAFAAGDQDPIEGAALDLRQNIARDNSAEAEESCIIVPAQEQDRRRSELFDRVVGLFSLSRSGASVAEEARAVVLIDSTWRHSALDKIL
jgi:hypothetical protein